MDFVSKLTDERARQDSDGVLLMASSEHQPQRRTWSFHKALENRCSNDSRRSLRQPKNVQKSQADSSVPLTVESITSASKHLRSSSATRYPDQKNRYGSETCLNEKGEKIKTDVNTESPVVRKRSSTLPQLFLMCRRPNTQINVTQEMNELYSNNEDLKVVQQHKDSEDRQRVLIIGSPKCGKSSVIKWLQSLTSRAKAVAMNPMIVNIDFLEESTDKYETWLETPVDVVVFLFSQNNMDTFKSIAKCLHSFFDNSATKSAVLAGTMFDLKTNEDIKNRAKSLSKEFEIPFLELSFNSKENFLALWMTISSFLDARNELPKRSLSQRRRIKK